MNFSIARKRMVDSQILGKGINDPRVVAAMLEVPRHLFVEQALESQAYSDFPLPIGYKQTISQPFMVAFMTQALSLGGGEKVLEIGTGSGYQAAVLSRIAGKVYTVERIPELARRARRILDQMGVTNVNLKVSDGTFGWEEAAPFEAIMVTAGAPSLPACYRDQLSIGGRLVIPVGPHGVQVLKRFTRTTSSEFLEEDLLDCRFVPLVGGQGWKETETR